MRQRHSVAVAVLVLMFVPLLRAQTKQRAKATELLPAIQKASKANDAAALERLLPAQFVAERRLDADATTAWRAEFTKELAAAKFLATRERDDDAVVRFTNAGSKEEREVPLRYAGNQWVIAAAQSYVVKGKSLDDRNGKSPARITLQARTDNDGYGKSAFSFTQVTAVADECKNRMDVWHCHNGDLHTVRGNRIADLGNLKQAKIDGLPIGVAWSQDIAPKRGNVYVIHCLDGVRRDFYVKLAIVDLRPDAITIEWTLLSDGLNAPADISQPQPLVSTDGADGADGLCGKRGK